MAVKLKSIRQLSLSTAVVLLLACGGSAEPVSIPPLDLTYTSVVEEIAAQPPVTTQRTFSPTPTKTPSAPTPTFTLTHTPIPLAKLVDLSDVSIICESNEQSKVVLCSISPDIDTNKRKWSSNGSAQR
ncbi:uncharacterized protein METZ01_LOCUS232709 [marine metagenome]|uniref:Uncharacterized protein n=1 Tax=marine metagenome TaxID=408172 RepID=A0A382GYE2_9ZZZZ